MNVDDLLANPSAACELPDGAVPLHALILIEYAEPGSDDEPGSPRLTCASDDALAVWHGLGLLSWAQAVQEAAMASFLAEDEDDE